ncbi:MAG: twin-arginine translocase TatA/TatE family subunit [Acidimicrobiales bacterium]|nr:twin-arginine translocase TatA/TatE family subunit [Acidimicrobiales bacterium]
MIGNIVGPDGIYIIIIAVIVLVGGSQLPKIARNVGLAGREFRKAQHEAEQDAEKATAGGAVVPPPQSLSPPEAQPTTAADPSITLTPAQLEAMLKAREEQVRNETGRSGTDN